MSEPAVKIGNGKGGFGLAVVAVAAIAIALIVMVGKMTAPERPRSLPTVSATPAPAAPEPITRAAFRQLCRPVMRRDACLASLGKPDRTQGGTGGEFWYYDRRTRDELTGRVDGFVQLKVEDGEVTAVNFF